MMAYEVRYWEMEGASDIELRATRIAKLEDIERDRLIESRPLRTDVITLDRSDNQSVNYKELWRGSNYIDLNNR